MVTSASGNFVPNSKKGKKKKKTRLFLVQPTNLFRICPFLVVAQHCKQTNGQTTTLRASRFRRATPASCGLTCGLTWLDRLRHITTTSPPYHTPQTLSPSLTGCPVSPATSLFPPPSSRASHRPLSLGPILPSSCFLQDPKRPYPGLAIFATSFSSSTPSTLHSCKSLRCFSFSPSAPSLPVAILHVAQPSRQPFCPCAASTPLPRFSSRAPPHVFNQEHARPIDARNHCASTQSLSPVYASARRGYFDVGIQASTCATHPPVLPAPCALPVPKCRLRRCVALLVFALPHRNSRRRRRHPLSAASSIRHWPVAACASVPIATQPLRRASCHIPLSSPCLRAVPAGLGVASVLCNLLVHLRPWSPARHHDPRVCTDHRIALQPYRTTIRHARHARHASSTLSATLLTSSSAHRAS